MKRKKIKMSITEKVFAVIGISFTAIGIIMLVVMLGIYVHHRNVIADSELIYGRIISMEYRNSSKYGYTTVEYVIGNKRYSEKLNQYNSIYSVGNSIPLYVNKKDYSNVTMKSIMYNVEYIVGGIGTLFLIIGLAFFSIIFVFRRRKKLYLENGKEIYAVVIGGRINFKIELNGRHPYILECQYEDSSTGRIYKYKDRNVNFNPQDYIGQKVRVYTKMYDMNKYIVDTESLLCQEK